MDESSNESSQVDEGAVGAEKMEVMIDHLPDVPFEKILSYLSLQDRIRSRAVSRSWCQKIDGFRVKRLCFSSYPVGFLFEKRRLINGAFAQNFVWSASFESFFCTFGQSILFSIKHLRLCNIALDESDRPAFAEILHSFGRLEELDIYCFNYVTDSFGVESELELELPMLTRIQLENFNGVEKLVLDAPRLQQVKIWQCTLLMLDVLYADSVEKLVIDDTKFVTVKRLKNLRYLYAGCLSKISSTFLTSLKQLREIHLDDHEILAELFEQKQRLNRVDLKIYLCGLLLDGPDDPAINLILDSAEIPFACWTENASRLAVELPFYHGILYSQIESVPRESVADILGRVPYLNAIIVDHTVQDIERFLDTFKFGNICELDIGCAQPQDLFDRLPDHCDLQRLTIMEVQDWGFLFKLKNLIELDLNCSIRAEIIQRAFEELEFLSFFSFKYANKKFKIEFIDSNRRLRQFWVHVEPEMHQLVPDLNAAIRLIKNETEDEKTKETPERAPV